MRKIRENPAGKDDSHQMSALTYHFALWLEGTTGGRCRDTGTKLEYKVTQRL